MRMILVLVAVISLVLGQGQRYLSVPFVMRESEGRTEHIIDIEINRYPYLIDITIDDRKTYFLNISETSMQKQMVDRADYRKNKQGILGLVQFIGVQHPDWRLQLKRRLVYTLYYLIRDILPQMAGFNLQTVGQIHVKERLSTLSEGMFNFGPSSTQNSVIVDLKKYNVYMKEPIVSFSMHQTNGYIFLGAFPFDELNNPLAYQTVQLESKNDFWEVNMQSLILKIVKDNDIQRVNLFQNITQFKLTLASKTLVLPKVCGEAIEKSISGCKFVVSKGSSQRQLECYNLDQTSISKLELQFSVVGSTLPLVFRFKHLLKLRENGLTTFHVSYGDDDKLCIGQTLLRQYMLGINYRDGLLYYGKGAEQVYINRFWIFRVLVIINLLVFVLSLLVVFTMGGHNKEIGSIKVQGSRYFPRSSGYQMAEVNEQSLGE